MTTPQIKCPSITKLNHINHAFFTRNGGFSSGIYDSLNCGAGSKDDSINVKKNHDLVIRNIADNANINTLYQIHSTKVITITGNETEKSEADAHVTNVAGQILGIVTADCTPVLFADNEAKVIGAAHAGWKGAIGGILENTIQAMENLGASRQNITAAIGPTIAQESYEVGAEFYERFVKKDNINVKFFIPSIRKNHYMFNLTGFVEDDLAKCNIAHISNVKRDTCAEENNFFSYRRSCLKGEVDYGRNISVICLA